MKMNKKGFTLIEMLVVIAIIAVLVSIVIPVVGNSTEAAGEAADAANIRSAIAEVTTLALANPKATDIAKTVALKQGDTTKWETFDTDATIGGYKVSDFTGDVTITWDPKEQEVVVTVSGTPLPPVGDTTETE